MTPNPAVTSLSPGVSTLGALADEIIATHHVYVRRAFPQLRRWADEVSCHDGAKHYGLVEIPARLRELEDELVFHLLKEEQMLFPRVKRMERSAAALPAWRPLKGLIDRLEQEHRNGSDAMSTIRRLIGAVLPCAAASEQHGLLLTGLAEFEADLLRHIHEEDAILFPRALELESRINR
jgi:regulator of cell morphogenesis and NO signaling